MPKEEWGVKHICPTTGERFYDMNRKPIVSPYTGQVVTLDANTRTQVAAVEKVEPKAAETDVADEEVILDDDDGDKNIGDDLLDDEEDDTVSLEEIASVASEGDDS